MPKNLKIVGVPPLKKDWVGKHLLLKKGCPEGQLTPNDGIPVQITVRMNAKETMNTHINAFSHWGAVRVLKCLWRCPNENCRASHAGYIPESWISEGKAVFVEVAKEGQKDEKNEKK
jgi:hypothetical protein